MADPARARKLAVRIRQIVSSAIEMQIKDPRLGMVTVTDARVTNDLREATVFYTVYGDDTEAADSARALASAAWRAKEIGKLSVPAGILSGLVAGGLYNRYSTITLPSYLGFFGGRRFVPIASGIAGIGLALAHRLAGDGHHVVGLARGGLDGFPGTLVPVDLGDGDATAAVLADLTR